MSTRVDDSRWSLSEKEKQTLRLIVRGHDAKSIARSLDLSVHTVNERLRDARRKMAVPSSREAARMLFEVEGAADATPHLVGDTQIGEDATSATADVGGAPINGVARPVRRAVIIAGALVMIFVLAALALTIQPDAAPAPSSDAQVVAAAQRFLVLVDEGKYDESYQATARSFHALNTVKVWTDVSRKVRVPLGATVSRELLSQEDVPAPPHGYEVVKFRTRFANRSDVATETVSLDREDGVWRVVGVYVE